MAAEKTISEKLLKSLSMPIVIEDEDTYLSASLGREHLINAVKRVPLPEKSP
jgi:hypothetical protein